MKEIKMKMRSEAPMLTAKVGYIVISVVFCIAGMFMIAAPQRSLSVIIDIFSAAMILFGVVRIVGYFSHDLYRLAFQYDLQFGVLMIVLGITAAIRSENVLNFLCLALGICILADGLFKIQIAIDAREFGIESWWLTAALAAAAGTVGMLLILKPTESLGTMTVLLGISLLAEGALNLCVALSTVKVIPHQIPDSADRQDYRFVG